MDQIDGKARVGRSADSRVGHAVAEDGVLDHDVVAPGCGIEHGLIDAHATQSKGATLRRAISQYRAVHGQRTALEGDSVDAGMAGDRDDFQADLAGACNRRGARGQRVGVAPDVVSAADGEAAGRDGVFQERGVDQFRAQGVGAGAHFDEAVIRVDFGLIERVLEVCRGADAIFFQGVGLLRTGQQEEHAAGQQTQGHGSNSGWVPASPRQLLFAGASGGKSGLISPAASRSAGRMPTDGHCGLAEACHASCRGGSRWWWPCAPALRKAGSTSPPSHGGMGCQRRCTCPCGAIDHPCRQAR